MSTKAEEILRDVNATMNLESMPLTDFEIEIFSKLIDGEIDRNEAFALFNASIGLHQ